MENEEMSSKLLTKFFFFFVKIENLKDPKSCRNKT